jgi:hypothetical protein
MALCKTSFILSFSLLAAKVNYFGLSGSIETWKQQLQKDTLPDRLMVKEVIEFNDNVKRQVLIMKRQ